MKADRSSEERKQRELSGVALTRAVRLNIAAGSLGSVYGLIVIGAFQTGFAQSLGLTDVQFGFMAAIPLLAFPARLLASFLVERVGQRKLLFTVNAILSRVVWVLILLLPFLLTEPSALRSSLFLVLLLLSSAVGAMAEPLWYSWLGDLIPEKMRARFWTKRSTYVNLFSILPSIAVAVVKDTLSEEAVLGSTFEVYAVVFGFAVFCGVLDIVVHVGIPEPKMEGPAERQRLLRMLWEPFRDRRYRPYLVFRPIWEISLTLLGPFPTIYLLAVLQDVSLELPVGAFTIHVGQFSIISLFTALQILIAVFTYPIWGVLMERYGSKPVLQLSTLLIAFTPLLWLFVSEKHLIVPTLILFVVVGASFSGLNLSIVSLLIGIAPKRNRSMYVAVDLTVTSLVGAAGPILAGYFMDLMGDTSFGVLGMSFGGFQLLCVATCAVRMYARTFLFRIQEGAKISTAGVVRRLAEANPLRVFTNIYALAAPSTEARRLSVVSRLGSTGTRLATQDLVKYLNDPSPRVREEAVDALAKSRDPEAVDALVAVLQSSEYGLEQQAARALGRIGDQRAVQPLIAALSQPEARIRAGAALALGEIGDTRAAGDLLAKLQTEEASVAFNALATALSQLGELLAIWEILPALQRSRSPVRRRELAIAMANLLGKPGAFYHYLDEESKVFGQRAEKLLHRCRRQLARPGARILAPYRRRLPGLLAAIERSYLEEDWEETVRAAAEAGEILTDAVLGSILHEEVSAERGAGGLTNPFAKISLIVSHDDRKGMQLWYLVALGRRSRAGEERGARDAAPEAVVGFEECLLDLYVLELVCEELAAGLAG